MKSFMQKAALVLICLPSTMIISLLTASQVQICQEYAAINETFVTMIITIPNLFIILGLLTAPTLLRTFHGRDLIVFGMTIFVIVSVLPVWCENFYLLLVLRAISGASFGLVLPIQATYIATYPENERAKLLGLNVSIGCLIGAAMAFVSGMIASVNWRFVFYLYLINIFGVVLSAIYLPRDATTHEENSVKQQNVQAKNDATGGQYANVLFVYYFLLIGCFLFITVLGTQIGPYLENVNLGGTTESGLLASVNIIGSLTGGIVFQYYIRYSKQYAMIGIFLSATVGMLLLSIAPSLIIVAVGVFLVGMCTSLMSSTVIYRLSCDLPLQVYTTASAWLNIFIYVLQFFAPILFAFCLGMAPMGSFRIVFAIYAAVQFVMIIMAYLLPKMLLSKGSV